MTTKSPRSVQSFIGRCTADGIYTITFNRSEKKNAFTFAMYQDVADALHEARGAKAVRAIVIQGSSGVFSAGNDLNDFLENPPKSADSPVFGMLLALANCEKPVIAAVQGPAIGIGTTMLLHCDFVFAAEGCRFQLPFVNLGLTPEGASTFLLPRLAGDRLARELLMLGEPFSAEKALRAGIVSEVMNADDVIEHAQRVARTLAHKPENCLAKTKLLLREATARRVEEALQREGEVFMECLRSAEAQEAFSAFLEKRLPDFSKA